MTDSALLTMSAIKMIMFPSSEIRPILLELIMKVESFTLDGKIDKSKGMDVDYILEKLKR